MKDITKLTNYITPDGNNAFGRLKDSIYVAGVVSEVGSRILADFVMDLISLPYYIARRRGVTPNDLADNTSSSQVFDLVFDEVDDHVADGVDPVARQLALSSWTRAVQTVADVGPDPTDFEYFSEAAARNGRHLFLYFDVNGTVYVIIYANGFVLGRYLVTSVFAGTKEGFGLTTNSTKFAVSKYNATVSVEPACFTSTDGTAWSGVDIDADPTRAGGKVIGVFGETLVIVAYNDPDNSYYESTDDGATWARTSQTVTAPLYKPVALASAPTVLMWVDEAGTYVRALVGGTVWVDATINGGALVDSINKDIVWTGDRFVIRDSQANIFISRENDYLNFDMFPSPTGGIPTAIFGGNGIIGVMQNGQLYVATAANASIGKWRNASAVAGGDDSSTYPNIVSFDGSQHCLAGPRLIDAPSTAVHFSAPTIP